MHTRNVKYLVVCLHLWLAISAITTKDMGNVQTCEGNTESFSWHSDTQNLQKVHYYFKNNYIATSSSRVKFIDETMKYRLRVMEDDSVTFQIDNVTTEDSGEYKFILTYTNGDTKTLIGRLDVKENVLGNFNITCENDTETGVCTCGNNTGSDLYTWVFESPEGVTTEKTTKESKLDLRDFPKGCSVFCKRGSDCKKSNAFDISSGIELGDYNITVTNTTEDCRTLKCGEPVGTNTKYEWSIKVKGTNETHKITTTNTFTLCREKFDCSVKCQRNHDCTETRWMCFTPGQSGKRRRKRRTLDEQLVPCDEDTASGNQDDPSPITTGIAVAVAIVVIAGIAVIAILTVVTLRKLKPRAGRRSDSSKVETPANSARLELVVKTHQPEEKSDDELEELKDNKHL